VGLSAVDVYVQAPVTSNQKTIILVFAADSCWQYKDPSKMLVSKKEDLTIIALNVTCSRHDIAK
jgi:hypothetical protein